MNDPARDAAVVILCGLGVMFGVAMAVPSAAVLGLTILGDAAACSTLIWALVFRER